MPDSVNLPAGSFCVHPTDDGRQWLVTICRAPLPKQIIRRFESRDKAAEFAICERYRRREEGEGELPICFPEDCPCVGKGLQW